MIKRKMSVYLSTRRRIKLALIDLNGTCHVGDKLLGNANIAIQKLIKNEVKVKYVTNTTKESIDSIISRCQKLGIWDKSINVHTCISATVAFLEENKLSRPLCLIEDDTKSDFNHLDLNSEYKDCVIIGLSPSTLNYENLNVAYRLLSADPSLPIIAMHKGQVLQTSSGMSLGPGPFVQLLESVSNRGSHIMGKPSQRFFKSALIDGILLDETVMIGDDYKDDVHGAENSGIAGILVKTGKFKAGQEMFVENSFEDIEMAVNAIVKHNAALTEWENEI